jgi:hypothetical protein
MNTKILVEALSKANGRKTEKQLSRAEQGHKQFCSALLKAKRPSDAERYRATLRCS